MDAGGSWIAANDRGLTVCLLNHYPPRISRAVSKAQSAGTGSGFESRGTLVLDLAAVGTPDEADRLLGARDLEAYRPFTVMLFSVDGPPRLRRWNGSAALETVDAPLPPVSSSSFDSRAVVSARAAAWARLVGDHPDPHRLLAYHRSHLPERGPYSVCTHRETVTMRYHPGPPCEGAAFVVRSLPRRAPG